MGVQLSWMSICLSSTLFCISCALDGSAVGVSLYHPSDPIVQLTISNFSSTVLNANKSHLVEFYNSFCGHCRKFAPVYVRFSERVKDWSPVVAVSAINCALDENSNLCLNNAIDAYPSFRFFPPATPSYDLAKDFRTDSMFNLDSLKIMLIRAVLEVASRSDLSPLVRPDFSFVDNTLTLADIWNFLPPTVTHVALAFEDAEASDVRGAQLSLDLTRHERIKVKRLKSSHQLAGVFSVFTVPTVLVFNRTSSDELFRASLHQAQHQQILSLLYGPTQLSTTTTLPRTELPMWTTTEAMEVLRNKFYVSETDLLLAIRYSFYHEVGVKNLNGSLLRVLDRFVNFTAMYIPPSDEIRATLSVYNYPIPPPLERMKRARDLLRDLAGWLRGKVAGIYNEADVYVTGSEWKDKWTEMEVRHGHPFPDNITYDHCKGSRENYRGYSCGLWHTLHTLTVNAYLTHGVGPNAAAFDPVKILMVIRDYIAAYFGCTDCVAHFTRMADERMKIQENARFPSDAILWLWKAHNLANQRLAGDPTTEDPQFPKRQFPPQFLCDHCQDAYGEWDFRQVMKFMASYYTNIRPFDHMKTIRQLDNTAEQISLHRG